MPDRIDALPDAAFRTQGAQPIGRLRRTATQHDRIGGQLDREPVTGGDSESAPGFAWHGDLMLGAYLYA